MRPQNVGDSWRLGVGLGLMLTLLILGYNLGVARAQQEFADLMSQSQFTPRRNIGYQVPQVVTWLSTAEQLTTHRLHTHELSPLQPQTTWQPELILSTRQLYANQSYAAQLPSNQLLLNSRGEVAPPRLALENGSWQVGYDIGNYAVVECRCKSPHHMSTVQDNLYQAEDNLYQAKESLSQAEDNLSQAEDKLSQIMRYMYMAEEHCSLVPDRQSQAADNLSQAEDKLSQTMRATYTRADFALTPATPSVSMAIWHSEQPNLVTGYTIQQTLNSQFKTYPAPYGALDQALGFKPSVPYLRQMRPGAVRSMPFNFSELLRQGLLQDPQAARRNAEQRMKEWLFNEADASLHRMAWQQAWDRDGKWDCDMDGQQASAMSKQSVWDIGGTQALERDTPSASAKLVIEWLEA